MALINIEYGSVASSKLLNDNFNYLEDKIEDYSKNIANDKASLTSLINSQVNTTFVQLTTKINESLQAVYPVGSIYIGTTDECPIASLFGTWIKVSEGRVLQGVSGEQVAGQTVEAGLPNLNAIWYSVTGHGGTNSSGAVSVSDNGNGPSETGWTRSAKYTFDASKSNPIYKDGSTVQPPAYLVNIWRRTA
jgi:hypothetical protein